MKKFFIGILFALIAIGISAQTDSATLTLEGIVSPFVSISVTAESVATNLDLTTDQTDLLVATVTEQSNVSAGYTVDIDSANNTTFVATGNSTTLDYTLSYDGSQISFNSETATAVVDTTSTTPQSGVDREIRISYTGSNQVLETGTYSDTLTFTITAK